MNAQNFENRCTAILLTIYDPIEAVTVKIPYSKYSGCKNENCETIKRKK